jgi:hypothetical protein
MPKNEAMIQPSHDASRNTGVFIDTTVVLGQASKRRIVSEKFPPWRPRSEPSYEYMENSQKLKSARTMSMLQFSQIALAIFAYPHVADLSVGERT